MTHEELVKRVERLEALFDLLLVKQDGPAKTVQPEGSNTRALDFTAEALEVAEGTIKVHISSVMKRMQMRSRSQIPAIYEEWMDNMPPDLYLRQSGIPMGWATDPSQHTEITSQLRIKMR